MLLDDRFRDVQAEPEPVSARTELAVELEDAREVLLRDPDAGVRHGHLNLVVERRRAHGDLSSPLGEFDGVGEEVRENLKNPVMVDDRGERGVGIDEIENDRYVIAVKREHEGREHRIGDQPARPPGAPDFPLLNLDDLLKNLPQNADPDKVEARYSNGCLSITVGKREASKPRAIAIQ